MATRYFFSPSGGRDRRDQVGRELRLDVRRDGFEFAQAFGKQFQDAAAADEGLQTELLVESQDTAHQPQPVQVHEEPANGEGAN